MTRPLRTEDEIRAAGADAVRGWQLTDRQIDQVVAIVSPVAADVQAGQDKQQEEAA